MGKRGKLPANKLPIAIPPNIERIEKHRKDKKTTRKK